MAEIRYVPKATWQVYSCWVSNLGLGDCGCYPATDSIKNTVERYDLYLSLAI